MHFVQHYLDCLSQASYLVGDQAPGRAVVIDPRRDVQSYLDDAAAAGLRIGRVIETHVHATFSAGTSSWPRRPAPPSHTSASVLAAAGFHDVSDLLGGYEAWKGQREAQEEPV